MTISVIGITVMILMVGAAILQIMIIIITVSIIITVTITIKIAKILSPSHNLISTHTQYHGIFHLKNN